MSFQYLRFLEDGEIVFPYSLDELRATGVSVGENPDPRTLATHDVYHVYPEQKPIVPVGRRAVLAETPTQKHGLYVLEWALEDLPVDMARALAKQTLIRWADGFLSQFTAPYPQTEVLTWPMQSQAARNYLAKEATTAQIDFITGLADARGMSAQAMAELIVSKANPYEQAVQATVGLRSATEKAIDAAQPSELQAILDNAEAQAFQAAKALGLA